VQVRSYETAGYTVLEMQSIDMAKFCDELFHLSQRFYSEAAKGTGVGLFLLNSLVEGRRGAIEVDSQQWHRTTLRVHLGTQLYLHLLGAFIRLDSPANCNSVEVKLTRVAPLFSIN
jgi:light-regulated signal transduction histidine kinase (bacteriophytochrome)